MESVTERLMLTVIFILLSTWRIQPNMAAKIHSNINDDVDNTSLLRQRLWNSTIQGEEDRGTPLSSVTTFAAKNLDELTTTTTDSTLTTATEITYSANSSTAIKNETNPTTAPAPTDPPTVTTISPTTPRTSSKPSPKTCPETKRENYTLPETSVGSSVVPEGTICLNEDYTPVEIQCLYNGVWNLPDGIKCIPIPSMCSNRTFGNYTLPETSPGSLAIPEGAICLNEDYTPVTVQCFNNGTWNLPQEIVCPQQNISNTTNDLHEIFNEPPIKALDRTNDIIKEKQSELKEIDVHFISQILSKASTSDEVAAEPEKFVGTINKIMAVDKKILASSQELLNATDTILYSLDQLLLQTNHTTLREDNLLIHTINKSEEIFGAMITNEGNGEENNFHTFNVTYLPSNYSEILIKTNFEIAFVIPPKQIKSSDHYFITMFYNDNLFSNNHETSKLGSWIVSILFPTKIPNSNLKIYYKEFNNAFNQKCEYWKYGIEHYVAIAGEWSLDGNATKFKDGYYMCEVNHTTHFGMLVSGLLPDSLVLDVITIFGSVLSFFGITIILLTACFFKQWRSKANSKIILNVSVCLVLLIILFVIADIVPEGTFCTIVGILLHYMVIAQFCWFMTISYSSYRKFYMISNDHTKHVLLKFCGISWGLPSIVVITTAALQIETYNKDPEKDPREICYPKGSCLQFGVWLPLCIILAINLLIYILIAKNLVITKLDIRKHETKKSLSVPKSLILLFFMMGMTWFFGIVVAFTENALCLYLFCITATVQGFVIFLFYILDSAEIKQLWKSKLQQNSRKSKRGENINYRHNNGRSRENITESISG